MPTKLLCLALTLFVSVHPQNTAMAWSKGHRLIRQWALAKLPAWQRDLLGEEALARLGTDYTSLQDLHASGKAPELDPYCLVPGVSLSLHDVNAAEPSALATLWYLDRIAENLMTGKTDEAMKFLGVLCHWNEDPGCPGAHSSRISEWQLKTLLPPPKDKEHFNYLFGAGGIMDVGNYTIPEIDYTPQLLGRTREIAALRIYQHQRLLRQRAGTHIIPIVQDMMYGDGRQADKQRGIAALDNARHVADVIFTSICLSTGRFEDHQPSRKKQLLTDWLPEFDGQMLPHPYYVTPFLVNQAMDNKRQLHSLSFTDKESASEIRSGYGMGTPFSLKFIFAPGNIFERFTCRVGLHPTAGPAGKVAFAVVVNGQELIRTSALTATTSPVAIDVELPETDVMNFSLQTIASDGSAPSHNLTVWAEPTLWQKAID